MFIRRAAAFACLLPSVCLARGVTEFCLEGEFDLGARYQGTEPAAGEFYPTTWCVVTEDGSNRVMFSGSGRSNPDMDGEWTVAYLPPDLVRIVNRDAPPDIEFRETDNPDEALRVRRIDPRRLFDEFSANPEAVSGADVQVRDGRVLTVKTTADLPLRGRVGVEWNWDWANPDAPSLGLTVDGTLLYRATGRWRDLSPEESASFWKATPGAEPVQVPGDRWPAKVDMELVDLTDGVYLVRGVRTGFQHLVVDTSEGLVVADAPAGWVEFHHIPPSDLVPGLGVSGLSEKLVDFLRAELPTRPIRAVALTHFHDDHAGGARAFAAAGAEVFATGESASFFETALNRTAMPADRLGTLGLRVAVTPVDDAITIGSGTNRAEIVPIGAGPHAYAMLGVRALDSDFFFVSDVHVPRSDADAPTEGRASTECWFAEWAVGSLPPEVRVVNSHSAEITPVSRLERYLESDVCRLTQSKFSFPPLPEPVTNNAVAAVKAGGNEFVVSFAGLAEGKTHADTHAKTFVLDGLASTWTEAAPVPGGVGRLAAVAIGVGDRAYVFGGYTVSADGSEVSTPWVHAFDPVTGEFESRAPMPVPVDDAVAVSYEERFVYLISGWHDYGNVNLVQLYDVIEDAWVQATPIPGRAVFGHAGGIVDNTIVYCDGVAIAPHADRKRDFVANDECFTGIIDEQNPRRIDWRSIESHPGKPRYRMAAAGINSMDGVVFVGGSDNPYNYDGIGYDGNPSSPVEDAYVYSVSSNAWRQVELDGPASMDHRGLVPYQGRWLTIGGMLDNQRVTASVLSHSFE